MMYAALAVVAAYLIGSIPTAYIFGKMLKGIDIRQYGSGNVGATNVFRTVGKIPGIIVLVIDFLKGTVAVTLLPFALNKLLPDAGVPYENICIFLGAAAIAGHIWTVFLRFKGGKGVATTAGVMVGLFPVIFLIGLAVWVVVFAIWKYVSLASIAAAVALPILAVLTGKDLKIILFTSILCMVGVYGHRDNIKRLIQGKENRIVKASKS